MRLVDEQITSGELRLELDATLKKLQEISAKHVFHAPQNAQVNVIKSDETLNAVALQMRMKSKPETEEKAIIEVYSNEYLEIRPWKWFVSIFNEHLKPSLKKQKLPSHFNERLILETTGNYGLLSITETLELIVDIWYDKLLDASNSASMKRSQQSFPHFLQGFFLLRYDPMLLAATNFFSVEYM